MRNAPEVWEEPTGIICLIDWAEAYLDYSKESYVEKTFKEKKSAFKVFFKAVKPDLDVADLTPGMVQSFLIQQKKERSGYASNKERKNLLAGWNWGAIYMTPTLPKDNPFNVPKMPEERSPRYVPPEADFWKIYELAEGQDKVMLLAFIHLACRRGEAFRLKWADVDFKENRIRLWTRKRDNGSFEYEWLPMTENLKEGLLWWKQSCPIESEHVFLCLEKKNFCMEYYGGPFLTRQHFMRKLCEKAGVKPFGFHAIRHLSASLLYSLGHSLSVIQTILRHKSPSTTERYLKSFGLENAREALENLSHNSKQSFSNDQDYGRIMFGEK